MNRIVKFFIIESPIPHLQQMKTCDYSRGLGREISFKALERYFSKVHHFLPVTLLLLRLESRDLAPIRQT